MKRDEKDLLNLFRVLPPEQQDTLFSFAEFLATRSGETPREWGEPEPIPRPAEEKVVHAIKRLRATYPMLDHSKMLYEVSECMTQHVVMGKPAGEVIDELEIMFRSRYEGLKK
ncbi:MAG: Crp/Fnr family transcriptional regulator [Burkholderiales bacterium]|nr:Crp/Fnr family transcriptional regulator [Burkholderiales bacterium]